MARIPTISARLSDDTCFRMFTAEVADAERLLVFLRESAATTDQILTLPEEFPSTVAEEERFLVGMIDHPNRLMLLAATENSDAPELIGVLGLHQPDRRRVQHVVTLGITIGTLWRGRGVGRAMLSHALDWTGQHPAIEKVHLEVHDTNAAGRALYTRLGFEEEGRLRGQIQVTPGHYADLIQMGRWVKPPPARGSTTT